MSENRLPDYLEHMQQAATDACEFVKGLAKEDFLADKRTQQAVIMRPHHHRRGSHKSDGWLRRVCPGKRASAVAQHARHAQPYRPPLLRHQPRCGVEHCTNGAPAAFGAITRRKIRGFVFRRRLRSTILFRPTD